MIGAVRDLIHTTPGLVEALVGASDDAYPNLREAGLASIAGITKTRPADGMTMVYVPGGTFPMGSDESDSVGDSDEFSQHLVTLDAFWLDQTEVTNADYVNYLNRIIQDVSIEDNKFVLYNGDLIYDLICIGCEGWEERIQWNGERFSVTSGYEDHPVVLVSWYGAAGYCGSVGGRLPTEAEWEYAARGTEGWIFPWGDAFDCSLGNFDDEMVLDDYVVPGGEGCDGYVRTAPVGSFPGGASWCDAFDMAGNVWEWVSDWYDSDYYSTYPVDGWPNNPTGPADGTRKVLRGGGWDDEWNLVRAADRSSRAPAYRLNYLGFRCAGVAPGQ